MMMVSRRDFERWAASTPLHLILYVGPPRPTRFVDGFGEPSY